MLANMPQPNTVKLMVGHDQVDVAPFLNDSFQSAPHFDAEWAVCGEVRATAAMVPRVLPVG